MQIKHHEEMSAIASLFESKDRAKPAALDSLEFKRIEYTSLKEYGKSRGKSEGSQ